VTTGETGVSDDVKVYALIWSCQCAGWWLARSRPACRPADRPPVTSYRLGCKQR